MNIDHVGTTESNSCLGFSYSYTAKEPVDGLITTWLIHLRGQAYKLSFLLLYEFYILRLHPPPQTAKTVTDSASTQNFVLPKMSQLTFQNHCSACEATSAQWARANACTHSKLGLSSPGKPYPIPPTFGTDSHPYARQIGNTEIMTVPKPEVPQNKVWIQPEYTVVVTKNADMDYVKELVANIFPPGSKSEDAGPMPPRPNVPTPPGVPPRYRLSGLKMEGAIPPPRPYVPTPPYEHLSGFKPEDLLPTPRPNVPLPPDAPPNS